MIATLFSWLTFLLFIAVLPATVAFLAFKNGGRWSRFVCLASIFLVPVAIAVTNRTCLAANDGATDDPCFGESLLVFLTPFFVLSMLAGLVSGLLASAVWRRKQKKV